MKRRTKFALVLSSSLGLLVGGVALASTYTNGNPGQLALSAGSATHAACPNALAVGNQKAGSVDLTCAPNPVTTTTKPPPPTTTTLPPATLPPAPSSTFPNASNTGVPAGTTLTPLTAANAPAGTSWANGDLTITADNVVVSGFNITGCVVVQGHNATVQNTLVTAAGCDVVVKVDYNFPNASLLLQDSEVDGKAPNSTTMLDVGWSNYTLLRDNLHDATDAIAFVNGNDVIQDSYLHTVFDYNQTGTGIHADVLQVTEGSNDRVIHNTLENHQGSGTSGWMCCTDQGPVSNVDFEYNLIDASGYGIYGGAIDGLAHNPGLSNMVYAHNRFTHEANTKGPAAYTADPAITWTDNTFTDGVAIPQ